MKQPTKTVFAGRTEHRLAGKLHRTDGPALERTGVYKSYWVNGKRHRTDGPAVEEANGTKEYWVAGKLHRTDGPALRWPDGYKEYWVNGNYYSESEFLALGWQEKL